MSSQKRAAPKGKEKKAKALKADSARGADSEHVALFDSWMFLAQFDVFLL